jgi:hypothetical protein
VRGSVVSRVLAFGFVGFDFGDVSFAGDATRTSIPALEEFRRKGLKRDNRLEPVGLCAGCEDDVSGETVRSSVSMISESE